MSDELKHLQNNALYRGLMDFVTKALLGTLIYIGVEMREDISELKELASTVAIIEEKQANNREQIKANREEIKNIFALIRQK